MALPEAIRGSSATRCNKQRFSGEEGKKETWHEEWVKNSVTGKEKSAWKISKFYSKSQFKKTTDPVITTAPDQELRTNRIKANRDNVDCSCICWVCHYLNESAMHIEVNRW